MISLGMDLSLTATGIVKIKNGKIIDRRLIKSKPTGKKPIDELMRLLQIADNSVFSEKVNDPDIVAVEGLAFMARNTTALCQLAGLNYLIRERLYTLDIPFIIVAPSSLKKFITGKGNSAKDVILMEIYKRYGETFTDDNEADAFGLAKIGEAILKKTKLTIPQQEVVDMVKQQYDRANAKKRYSVRMPAL